MNRKVSLHDLLVHDLGGPISILATDIGNLLFKQEKYGKLTDEQKKVLERALRNARKAQSLLSEMVEALKSEEGKFEGSYFSVRELVRETLKEVLDIYDPDLADKVHGCENEELFVKALNNASIFLNFAGKYTKEDFFHDRQKIIQIMRNLFSNAIKFRRKRVEIRIFGDDDLHIMVEDDGPGISPQKKENIFKRFADIGIRKDDTPGGLGFGLSCVKAILESANGEIEIQSEEGRGTIFLVRIPPLR